MFVFLLPGGGDCLLGRATSFLPRSVKSLYTFRGVEVTDRSVCFLPRTDERMWWRRRSEADLVTFLENRKFDLTSLSMSSHEFIFDIYLFESLLRQN